MIAGFSQVRLDGQFDYRMGGTFANYMSSETAFHTPLYASAWAVKAGENSFIWASCDMTKVYAEDVERIRDQVEKATGLERTHILISATHNHTGPTHRGALSSFFPDGDLSFFDEINVRTARACIEAWENAQEVVMSYASCVEEKCTHNRRYLMDTGESKMHPGGPGFPGRLMKEGPEDPQLQAVWFMKDGKPAAIVVNYSAHPSILYGKRLTSADYPGVMRRTLQAVYGEDVPVIFLQGCCGNLTPTDHEHDATWGSGMDGAERVGTVLAADIIRVMAATRETKDVSDVRFRCGTARLNLREITEADIAHTERVFKLLETDRATFNKLDVAEKALAHKVRKLQKKWEIAPYEDVPVSAVRLDDIVFLTNPTELFCEYQLEIKKQLGEKIICVELTNDGTPYIATKQGYLLKGYETNQGHHDIHAGQTIADAMIDLAREVGR